MSNKNPKVIIDTSNGEIIDIKQLNENWSEFTLKDGTILRVKPIIMEVRRLKGQYAQNGDPIYVVKSTVITDAKPHPSLKRKTTSRTSSRKVKGK